MAEKETPAPIYHFQVYVSSDIGRKFRAKLIIENLSLKTFMEYVMKGYVDGAIRLP